ncbi:MAG: FkbM family methyltransferase [Acetobacteraceae bacterium]
MPSRFVENARLVAQITGPLGQALDYEGMLERTYRRLLRPGDTVLDIGAHSGRHTTVFAELAGAGGAVHAFEPLPEAIALFRARGLPGWVRLHETAIGEAEGMTEFIHVRGTPEESGLRVKAYNRPDLARPGTIRVRITPLDRAAAALREIALIKIDVEGGEIGVLRSGRETIARTRPWITVEYGYPGYSAYGQQRRALFDEACALGYAIGDLFGAVCASAEEWEQTCDRAYWDWYLVPRERAAAWSAALGGA